MNKKLYMDELTFEKTDGFAKLAHDIQSLYKMII